MHARCGSRRGGASPPLANHPRRGGGSRLPATANKFVHILWKNLICDNVAAAQFCARPRGRGCWRCKACACCFREGDAPAGCRLRARDARPYEVVRRGRGPGHFGAPRSSRPTIPVCNGIVFSGRAMRAPTRCKRRTARRAAKSPARDARAPSLPYLANILTAQGHYLRSIFTPFCAALINASTSSLVLNGANDTRMALSVRALGRPSALSTPLCLPLEHAEPLDT